MENRQWFIFYYSFYEALSDLPAENKLELYEAIAQYSFSGNEPVNLTWISIPMWKLIRPQLEANNKRYLDWCKGGRPKKETTGFDEKITTGFENEKPKEKEKEKVKEKDKEKILSTIVDNSEAETYWNQEINNLISELKEECNHLGVAYEKKDERNFAKHILTAKDYWDFAEKIWQDRVQFAKNILIASCQLKYKWICAWPKAIYQHYAEIYNEFMKNKPKMKAVVLDDL